MKEEIRRAEEEIQVFINELMFDDDVIRIAVANVAQQILEGYRDLGPWLRPPADEIGDEEAKSDA